MEVSATTSQSLVFGKQDLSKWHLLASQACFPHCSHANHRGLIYFRVWWIYSGRGGDIVLTESLLLPTHLFSLLYLLCNIFYSQILSELLTFLYCVAKNCIIYIHMYLFFYFEIHLVCNFWTQTMWSEAWMNKSACGELVYKGRMKLFHCMPWRID